ncbi:hypothetical protein LSAT2_031360 [Lamellibrachia satsuma]|nr:hypothetical protein LSAT2_031360 [Lamellibrachia satsuma]
MGAFTLKILLLFTVYVFIYVTSSPTYTTLAPFQINMKPMETKSLSECTVHCQDEYNGILNACIALMFKPSTCLDKSIPIRDDCLWICDWMFNKTSN